MTASPSPAVRRPPPTISTGRFRRLVQRYANAHRAFARGDFLEATERYGSLSSALMPWWVEIVERNGAVSGVSGELTGEQAAEVLGYTGSGDGSAKGWLEATLERLSPESSEGRIASLCAAVAHDVALMARHLAEAHGRGREPEIVDAVLKGFAHSLAVNPLNPSTLHNLGGYEEYLGRNEDAAAHYHQAVQIDLRQGESWVSLGHALARMGDRQNAEVCWSNAIMLGDSKRPNPLWHMAMLRLLKGDFQGGWFDYEARLSFPPYLHQYGRPDLKAPLWDGSVFEGTLYLHGEQGIGDVIQMLRYVPLCRERCTTLVVEVVPPLVRLARAMFPDLEIVEKGHPAPKHDRQLPMFSLPYVFGTTLETIPPPVTLEIQTPPEGGVGPVLCGPSRDFATGRDGASPARHDAEAHVSPAGICNEPSPRNRVPFRPIGGDSLPIQAEPRRIGLCWRGSATHPNDLVRSMPFEACAPLLDLASSHGLTFQSLQFGYDTSPPLEPCPVGDFLSTAEAIARCEVVITVDTSVAHLAASMGVPTWILLPYSAEWRWLQERSDSPWYESARLIRQEKPGDWPGVVQRCVKMITDHQQL